MTRNPVSWFEIPTTDIARATSFYETSFGWTLTKQEAGPNKMAWFPMTEGKEGAAGTLIQGEGYTPSATGSLVYFQVTDIPSTLKLVEKAGGRTLTSKESIGEHGFIARFQDTEGNRIALHSLK